MELQEKINYISKVLSDISQETIDNSKSTIDHNGLECGVRRTKSRFTELGVVDEQGKVLFVVDCITGIEPVLRFFTPSSIDEMVDLAYLHCAILSEADSKSKEEITSNLLLFDKKMCELGKLMRELDELKDKIKNNTA
jgi:hypothetical protein